MNITVIAGLGFTVGGGVDDHVFPNDNGIFVTKIIEGGVAHVDGRLAVGDRLMAVSTQAMDIVDKKLTK